ncbi:hypothetical protein IMY05_006G0081900 [Salix suchowensis]|nr:hypothetical protein IMY05_006G0081900 [Salix suchowensis]
MGMLGMRFFILSSFERKGMGFHEAFLPKKVELKGSCQDYIFLKHLNFMFVLKFWPHFGGPISTAPGLIFTLLREQRIKVVVMIV